MSILVTSASETAFVSVGVDLPVKKEEKVDSDGNEVAEVNKKRKAEKILKSMNTLLQLWYRRIPKVKLTEHYGANMRRPRQHYGHFVENYPHKPIKRGATISDRESLGVGHYEIERKICKRKSRS